MLQVREQEVLAGPQIAHGGSRCIRAGTQLIDHLEEGDELSDRAHTSRAGYHSKHFNTGS